VIESPRNRSLAARPLREAAGEVFTVCVVACATDASGGADAYAEDWLEAADAVVGCSSADTRSALEAALDAEEARGRNGALLALLGGGDPDWGEPGAGGSGVDGRPVFALGPVASSGTTADKGLRELVHALMAAADDHPSPQHPSHTSHSAKEEEGAHA
ncbi:MAG: hypothetical protein ACRDSJ_01705, partial [Rubrobacteraceae bacterium]